MDDDHPDGVARERDRRERLRAEGAPDPEGVGDVEQDLEQGRADGGKREPEDRRAKGTLDDTGGVHARRRQRGAGVVLVGVQTGRWDGGIGRRALEASR